MNKGCPGFGKRLKYGRNMKAAVLVIIIVTAAAMPGGFILMQAGL